MLSLMKLNGYQSDSSRQLKSVFFNIYNSRHFYSYVYSAIKYIILSAKYE